MCLRPAKNKGPWLATILHRDSGFHLNPLRCHGEGQRGGFFVSSLLGDRRALLPFPNKRVKHPSRFESNPLIERNRPIVRLGHGQRDEMESPFAETPG